MTTTETKPRGIPIKEFTAKKQTKLFATLKYNQFSGQFNLTSPTGIVWKFYFAWGRLGYATGGCHTVRRWARQVAHYCPEISLDQASLAAELSRCPNSNAHLCWEYQLLSYWHKEQKITQKQAAQVIFSVIVEALFEITQAEAVIYEVANTVALSKQLVLINPEQVIRKAENLWTEWQTLTIADQSPNLAPIINKREDLKKQTPESVYNTLTKLLDGQQTLYDLSLRLNRNVVEVTKSLLPYFDQDLITLSKLPDIDIPVGPKLAPSQPKADPTTEQQKPLVACVDDSPAVCNAMEKILTKSGYQVVTIQDPLRALATLLARKPDVIFLDLVMPNTNGYEICGHLRRLPIFKETPIIILTGNDGVVDRMRAKMVGASAFLTKPVKVNVLLAIVRKQLRQKADVSQKN